MSQIVNSLIIPVYNNERSIEALVEVVDGLSKKIVDGLEVVFVMDGNPDSSYEVLKKTLPSTAFPYQIIHHSRNFGSFAAIRTGLVAARGKYFAVMAADLQEPPHLIETFFDALKNEPVDITVGTRESREDPWRDRIFSELFWWAYKKCIQKEIPEGGVDIFACNQQVRDQLIQFSEHNSSLVGQLFWIGYRRKLIPYQRRGREGGGPSGWTFTKKVRYLMDSFFAFSDLPVQILTYLGIFGLLLSAALSSLVLMVKLFSGFPVPGYAATVLIILFFAGLNSFGLGLIGGYIWRTYENTKRRPIALIRAKEERL